MMSINEFKNNAKNIKSEARKAGAESVSEGGKISSVFGKLFEARDFAHYSHLRTDSYAKHKALGSFYEGVVDLADQFYETYAGQYGQVKFEHASVRDSDVIQYFESLGKMLTEAHSYLSEKDTHLHNILDEIAGLTYQTLYKLKFLK